MFHNEQPTKDYNQEPYDPDHSILNYSQGADVTLLLLVVGVILLLFRYYNMMLQFLGKLVSLFKIVKTEDDEAICDNDWNFLIDVDEQLGTYWTCLRGQDQKRWFVKEAHHYS